MADSKQTPSKIRFFRRAQSEGLTDAHCLTVEPMSEVQQAGWDKAFAEGLGHGGEVKVLVNIPGFSLMYVWFKRNYPLPPHSHNADCLYYIIAGGVRMGAEQLGPGDCFFIPADVPYTYKTSETGVELLEFRHANAINFVNRANGAAFWDKTLETVFANREDWQKEPRPSELAG